MNRILTGLLLLGLLIATAAQAATVTVNPANLGSGISALTTPVWFFYNDETDVIDNSLGSFVTGPGTPLSGVGSAQISVSGTQRRNLATYQFKGTALSAITELSYTTYNPSAGNGGSASRSAYLQFNVDFNGTDTFQRRLVFLPADNGAVVQNSWKTWDCLNGGAALWRYSGATWPAPISVSGTIPQTWNAILAAYPSIRLRLTDSWLGMRVGEPYPDGYTENIDNFTFGTAAGSKTFDFESGAGSNVVAALSPSTCITPSNPCVAVPVNITRTTPQGLRGFSVDVQLSPGLTFCAPVDEGGYLSSIGGTQFQVLDNGGGSYTIDGSILGLPCGATAATGTLFTLNLGSLLPSATGTVTITSVTLRDCANAGVPGTPGAPAPISIDNTPPAALSGLVAAQQLVGNPAGSTTNINLSWSAPGAGSTVQLYRRGFGNYPEYNDAPNAGSVPAAPGAYPPAGWALVATLPGTTTSFTDSFEEVNVNFESPAYALGNINGQNGWSRTGNFDHVVSGSHGWATFGAQSLRISDAITSGSFGDQTFAKPLVNAVGETDATAGAFSVGVRRSQFEMQFDLASVLPTQQPGMHVSVSPDRGDGSRMSYLRFEDNASGIDVFFDDVQGTTDPANFVETQVATLSRTAPHRIRLTMTCVDGPSNDIVSVYIDGALVHTGTSWENYYRFDSESASEPSPRIVKTVIFRTSGGATPANLGNGFLIDNLSLSSGSRDFWYYTAYVTDACGNHSVAATLTSGTLNYHLGDVQPVTGLAGNNLVNTADISDLGSHYGVTLAPNDPLNYLDVGPTTDFSVNARPTTDNRVQFEDLIMFAINYGQVSAPAAVVKPAGKEGSEQLALEVPELPAVGETFAVGLTLTSPGTVKGVSTQLAYNPAVVEPVGVEAGELLAAQHMPSVVLSSEPGDVDVALLGTGEAIAGHGEVARALFRVKAKGDAALRMTSVTARDKDNHAIALGMVTAPPGTSLPAHTALGNVFPNPFQREATIELALRHESQVSLDVYDLSGRRVASLLHGVQPAGMRLVKWDGRGERGVKMAPGIYLMRLEADGQRQTRRVMLVP